MLVAEDLLGLSCRTQTGTFFQTGGVLEIGRAKLAGLAVVEPVRPPLAAGGAVPEAGAGGG